MIPQRSSGIAADIDKHWVTPACHQRRPRLERHQETAMLLGKEALPTVVDRQQLESVTSIK
ncbi:hypothetical protein [Chamaesiphon sp. OTE_20_metabat_361]|uniref:hypothetical protein n=1 Tax=Chamaesiphon sp. OTE_20_metabat_361 TaxID=2964689 RepID=UPI00286A020C|nr:hypothetical protein [Chamaesiphon sp. OTE_20_metabat_361]